MIKKNEDIIILSDMDDTIENLGDAWINTLNARYGTDVVWQDIRHWDMHLAFPTLTREQIFGILYEKDFWSTVKPKEDAMKYVKKLWDEGYQLYICTSTDYSHVKEKFDQCLFRYFPYLTWKDTIIAHNKRIIKSDFLIDDGTHNFGGEQFGLLMDAPHNRNYRCNGNITKVYNWEEVYYFIKDKQMKGMIL